MRYVQLLIGFVILILGAEIMLHDTVVLSIRMGVFSMVIGITALTVGSSAPELVVSVNTILPRPKGISFTLFDLWLGNWPNVSECSCVDLRQPGLHRNVGRPTCDWLIITSMSKDGGPM